MDVSVELTAPSIDGSYTGFYELKNNKGETLAIGTETSFWVKILIGNVAAAPVVYNSHHAYQWNARQSDGTRQLQLLEQLLLSQRDRQPDQHGPRPGWAVAIDC